MMALTKQKGTFTIEFAIVGLLFGVVLMFSIDMLNKLAMKGKLDRMSYSVVNILKERTQLYGDRDITLEDAQGLLLYNVVRNSLTRTMGSFDSTDFSMRIEEQTYQDDEDFTANNLSVLTYPSTIANACPVETTLSDLEDELSVVSTWGRKTPLYRVTLCYETDNLVSGLLGNGFTTVQSSAVIVAR